MDGVDTGMPAPHGTRFCPTCGAPWSPSGDGDDRRERWELCHIRVAVVNDAPLRGTECFVAIALEPAGRAVVGRSPPFRAGMANQRGEEVEAALAALLVELLAASWQPWRAPLESPLDTPGHEPWHLYRFRRRVPPQGVRRGSAGAEHASTTSAEPDAHRDRAGAGEEGGRQDRVASVEHRRGANDRLAVGTILPEVTATLGWPPTGDAWESCEIEAAESPVDGTVRFVAQARGRGKTRLLGASPRLESREQTPDTEAALAQLLVDAFRDGGWEWVGTGTHWYSVRLRSSATPPRHTR